MDSKHYHIIIMCLCMCIMSAVYNCFSVYMLACMYVCINGLECIVCVDAMNLLETISSYYCSNESNLIYWFTSMCRLTHGLVYATVNNKHVMFIKTLNKHLNS